MERIKTWIALILNFIIMTTTTAMNQQTGNIYVFESDGGGFNTKTIFYDDGLEVVAFDAQFTVEIAEQAIRFLRTRTTNPLTWLVVTHPNPDKFNGIAAFQKAGAKVVMSGHSALHMKGVHEYKKYYFVEMAKMFTAESYPALPTADVVFKDTYKIVLANGGTIELKELGRSAIATNQTVAYIKAANALVVGDLVHHNVHAWLEGPVKNGKATYNNQHWIAVLQQLQKEYPADVVVYGGRGDAVKLSISVPQQIAYLEEAENITRKYINSLDGASLSDKKSKVDYSELQKLFEKAYPTYGLAYMIGYGAYGIVESINL